MPGLKQKGIALYHWLDRRLGFVKPITEASEHPIPSNSASWWYVFGSAASVILMLQVVTGILLALVYTPTARDAWNSLNFLNHGLTLGWFLRAMHGWGSDFMIAIVLIHMTQVFMFGAYKFPRELTWIVGVFLLLLTLGMAFTGQVLRFDQDAYWGLGIGASIMGRVPWIGAWLVHFMLGGPIIGATTFSRFFALHVFIIPGILIALVGVHVWMVLRLGINEWPMPGRLVRRSTYMKEYEAEVHKDGVPFVPDAAWKDVTFSAAIILAIMACAIFFGPIGPSGPPDPTIIQTVPKPDVAVSLDLCDLRTRSATLGNGASSDRAGCCHLHHAGLTAVCRRRRKALVAPSRRCVDGMRHCGFARHPHQSGRTSAVEPGHECVERRSGAAKISKGSHSSGKARRGCISADAVPQLPFARWRRRKTRTRAESSRDADDRERADPSGAAGKREYAGLWQCLESAADHGAGALS